MAYERTTDSKVKGDSLDAFVKNMGTMFSAQVASRNAEDELGFNTAVLENNLSLDDQLNYRKEQLKRVSDDPAERARIRGEISTLKNRIQQEGFANEYLGKLSDLNSGISSIDSVISWLQTQQANATDPEVQKSITEELAKKQAEKFTLTKQLIQNHTTYAVNDKGGEVIQSQIDKVSSAKNKALLAGDDTLASNYDIQLQSLNKALAENSIDKDIKNFAVATISGYATATKLLDAYNEKISSSIGTGPVTIGGVTYSSPKEFWGYKRDSYVADSSNAGFFGRLDDENKATINVANSKNNLDSTTLATVGSNYNSLLTRPELAGYENKINATKQDTLQSGANLLADKIINTYAIDYDIDKAIGAVNALKLSGVNVDSAFTKLMTTAASVKQGQVNNILGAAQTAMQNNPSLTPEQALNQAIATGAGTVLSPNELVKKDEKTIAGDLSKTAINETGKPDPRTTVAPAPTTPTPATPAGTPTASVGFKTITIKAGDTLSSIAQRELGSASKYQEIATYNNIADPNKISAGAVIKIPIASTAAPAPAPAPTPIKPTTPTSAPVPTPTTPTPPAPTPTSVQGNNNSNSAYTFKANSSGNVEVYQNGQRVSTTSLDNAKKSYGYTG